MSLYGCGQDIEEEKKVEAMWRSKKKTKELVIEHTILVSCPSFSSLYLATSSSQELQLLQ